MPMRQFVQFALPRLLRAVLIGTLILLIAACGAGGKSESTGPAIQLDDLPQGIGRGFPIVSVDPEGNKEAGLHVGDKAPNFFLTTADGRTLTMDALRGRPVLINHWATWCPPCREEMPTLIKAAEEHPDLVIIAADHMEDGERVEAFAKEFGMTMPVTLDADGVLSDLFSVRAFPTSVFIDREGNIAGQWVGYMPPDRLQEMLAKVL